MVYSTWQRVGDDDQWSGEIVVPGVRMSSSPAAVVFQGKLYVFHERAEEVGWISMTVYDSTTNSWSADQPVMGPHYPMQTSLGPAAIVLTESDGAEVLYLFSEARGNQGTLLVASFDGFDWTPQLPARDVNGMPLRTRGRPGLAVLDGVIYCFREKREDLGKIYLSRASF